MLITKFIEIDMGHRVPNHKSKCKNLHGHRYKIEVGVDDKVIQEEGVSDEGMVIDFSDLKEIMMQRLDSVFDHGFVMHDKDDFYKTFLKMQGMGQNIHFVPFVPTAENLAKHWYNLIKNDLKERGIKISHVRVWETPTSTAMYTRLDEMEKN